MKKPLLCVLLLCVAYIVSAQTFTPNYDETRIPPYVLPEPLICNDGSRVSSPEMWYNKRRAEILSMFATYVYGRTPATVLTPTVVVHETDSFALSAAAVRKQLSLCFTHTGDTCILNLLLYLPRSSSLKQVPVFLGLNFSGNHTILSDPAIFLSQSWIDTVWPGVVNFRATELSRGTASGRWPVEKIISRGYGLATMYYGDIDPDFDDGFQNGIHPLFRGPAQKKFRPDDWGSIGAWAWGLSRALDYLQTDPAVDPHKIIVIGHSRLGKTALWAAAQDERFFMAISNNSGCGGAALSRRAFGETVEIINTYFPHWFCDNFLKYKKKEHRLPVDQHMLLSLIAPRRVYVASAADDLWADPRGEFLSLMYANEVYRFLGTTGLPSDSMPSVNQPVIGRNGYHIRSGKHDITSYDWEQYLNFCDQAIRIE